MINKILTKKEIISKWEKNTKPVGLYIHNPFCMSNCNYCPFKGKSIGNNISNNDEYNSYIEYLFNQISFYDDILSKQNVRSLFLGGGTANLITDNHLIQLLEKINYDIPSKCIEIHPSAYNSNQALILKNFSFNSIILCVQTFNHDILKNENRVYKNYENIKNIIEDFHNQKIYVMSDLIIFWKYENSLNVFIEDVLTLINYNIDTINIAIDYSYHKDEDLIISEKTLKIYSMFINECCEKYGYYPSDGGILYKDETISLEKTMNILKYYRRVIMIKKNINIKHFRNIIYPQMETQDQINISNPSLSILGIGSIIKSTHPKTNRMNNSLNVYSKIAKDFQYCEIKTGNESIYYKQYDKNDFVSDSDKIIEFFNYIAKENVEENYEYSFSSHILMNKEDDLEIFEKIFSLSLKNKRFVEEDLSFKNKILDYIKNNMTMYRKHN